MRFLPELHIPPFYLYDDCTANHDGGSKKRKHPVNDGDETATGISKNHLRCVPRRFKLSWELQVAQINIRLVEREFGALTSKAEHLVWLRRCQRVVALRQDHNVDCNPR